MRMRKIVDNRTLKSVAAEFLAFKRAQKIRERTLHDYQKYINPFIEQSSNSMDIDVLKRELLEYFANIPATSPARYNHPYQYLHALFAWCAKQDYIPFDKLDLKKIKDEGIMKKQSYMSWEDFVRAERFEFADSELYAVTPDGDVRIGYLNIVEKNSQSMLLRFVEQLWEAMRDLW